MDTSFQRSRGASQEWYTPRYIIEALGPFDLDPCAPTETFYTAAACYTKQIGGLSRPWSGRVWLNPPYNHPLIDRFIRRLADHGNGIALIFNRMDTAMWHDTIFPTATAIKILRKRIKFLDSSGMERDPPGCGSILVAYGEHNATAIRDSPMPGKYIHL